MKKHYCGSVTLCKWFSVIIKDGELNEEEYNEDFGEKSVYLYAYAN